MTDTPKEPNVQSEREAFEKWCGKREAFPSVWPNDVAWIAWQARAALASRAAVQSPAEPTDEQIKALEQKFLFEFQDGQTELNALPFARAVLALAGQASTQAPAGYKLVPIEPTVAMLEAAATTRHIAIQLDRPLLSTKLWAAMLAAAPAPVGVPTRPTDEEMADCGMLSEIFPTEQAATVDPKLPAAAGCLVGVLEKIREKCRPGYMVSKFVVDWINEATEIAQAINASLAVGVPPCK